ncbi:MAG: DUF3343 domain-containing protein [Deltaproteobacteria bacterium]|nr:DUF3343 domain-containing protein [Deltaproteobacteria bacterium]
MTEETAYVLILPSIHYVLKVEKEAKARSIPIELIPTPRQISTDCGMAVELRGDHREPLLRMLLEKDIPAEALFRRSEKEFEEVPFK